MLIDLTFIIQTAIVLLMIMDPFGNLPVFLSTLSLKSKSEFYHIVLRESIFALVTMLLALLLGRSFMKIMHVNGSHLQIAGGIILLIVGLKMIFSSLKDSIKESQKEPFIVPLAIPLICGPGLIALLVTLRNSSPSANLLNCLSSVLLAWSIVTIILISGKFIANLIGDKVLDAMESLMGLLLTCISVSFLIQGINNIYGLTERCS